MRPRLADCRTLVSDMSIFRPNYSLQNTSMYDERPVPTTPPILGRGAEVTANHPSMDHITVPHEARNIILSTYSFDDPDRRPGFPSNRTPSVAATTSANPPEQPQSMYGDPRQVFTAQEHSKMASATKVNLGAEIRTTDTETEGLNPRMTQEFIIVPDLIQSCIRTEEDYQYKLILKAFTTLEDSDDETSTSGVNSELSQGSASKPATSQKPWHQDHNWQTAMLYSIHERRILILRYLNSVKKDMDAKVQDKDLHKMPRVAYSTNPSFLDCLIHEKVEWESLWRTFQMDCEHTRLSKERLSTLGKVWGVEAARRR